MLPLTYTSIMGVASCFRKGIYRKFENSSMVAKQKHLEAGYEWGQTLDLAVNWANRAVARGRGPAQRAATFDVAVLAAFVRTLSTPHCPIIPGGPSWPYHLRTLASLFVTR